MLVRKALYALSLSPAAESVVSMPFWRNTAEKTCTLTIPTVHRSYPPPLPPPPLPLEIGFDQVAQAILKYPVFLLQPLGYWDYRYATPNPTAPSFSIFKLELPSTHRLWRHLYPVTSSRSISASSLQSCS